MAKRLVICCDGTWNVRDRMDRGKACPSNVAKMAPAVAPRDLDEIQQPIFYDKGVGTGVWDRVRGGAFGWGLSKHVRDAYRFIVEQYEPVDEIFLFGCSRGAYTARSTAGLIRNSGVLRPEHEDKVIHAYNLYRRRDDASLPQLWKPSSSGRRSRGRCASSSSAFGTRWAPSVSRSGSPGSQRPGSTS